MSNEERAIIDTLNEVCVYGETQARGKFLVSLYQKILKNDESFYFLDEFDFLLIRCSPGIEDEIREYAKNYSDFIFDFLGPWRENSALVTTYSDYFMRMMHNNSVFVLEHHHEFSGYDGERMLERICHLSFNVFKYMGMYPHPEYALYTAFAQGRVSMHYQDMRNGN